MNVLLAFIVTEVIIRDIRYIYIFFNDTFLTNKCREVKNMKTKMIGFFICMLFIVTALQVVGTENEIENNKIISELNSCVTGDDLDTFTIDTMEYYHVPGLSASVVKSDNLIWSNSYGYANITNSSLVQDMTLFYLASVSKTITGVAMMQLYEDGLFDLDDPINDYLPFDVIHPDFPSVDITFHMLLTHSSGINDNYDIIQLHIGDSPNPLGEWLEDYLTPGGQYYDPDNNFDQEPGTSRDYSNVGVGLVGYLVEVISGIPFDEYCEINIFEPLEMDETSWFLENLNINNIAVPYIWDGNDYVPQPHWGRDFYPASTLRTSVLQLSNFHMMMLNKGEYNSEQILEESTVDYMWSPQLQFYPTQGIIWYQLHLYGRTLWMHDGNLPGLWTQISYYPESDTGVIVLTNGENYNCVDKIVDALYKFAETPYEPDIDGTLNGKTGIEYEYTFNAVDPDGNDVKFHIDWDDGETETTEFHPSGTDVKVKHTWSEEGSYIIKATAEDIDGFVGPEGTLSISMPVNRQINNYPLLQLLLERFFNAFPILKLIFGF